MGPYAVKPHSVLQFSLSALCNLCNSNLNADSCCRLPFSLLSEHGCCVQLFKVQRSLKSTFVKTINIFGCQHLIFYLHRSQQLCGCPVTRNQQRKTPVQPVQKTLLSLFFILLIWIHIHIFTEIILRQHT